MRECIAAWDRFFFSERPARPLRIFRAIFGAWLVTYYLRLYELLHLHFGRDGLVNPADVEAVARSWKVSVFVWLAGNETAFQLVFLLALLSAAALCVGFQTRVAPFLAWATNLSLVNPMMAGNSSADQIVSILTFLFFLAGAAGHLEPGRATIPAWSSRLFQVQLAMVYFFSGWMKTASSDWYRGEAMHFVFQQPAWSRFSFHYLDDPFTVGLITYGTLLFELVIFPALVWIGPLRPWVLLGGVLFHAGIALTMKVFVFGEVMPIAYLAFLGADSRVIGLAGAWRKIFAPR
jgi:hypothetical protein